MLRLKVYDICCGVVKPFKRASALKSMAQRAERCRQDHKYSGELQIFADGRRFGL
jgi:hypothetical protein